MVGTKPGAVVDWNSVYQRVESSFSRLSSLKSNFSFPEEFKYLVADSGPRRSGNPSRRALEECPLGAMYLRLLYYYQGLTIHNLWHEEIEEEICHLLAAEWFVGFNLRSIGQEPKPTSLRGISPP